LENREYKSSVFTTLFGNKEKIIELYGAIEGKVFPDNVDVKINTLQNALFLGRLNDVSFTIVDKLVILIEHQSTINENMPMRALRYISEIYDRMFGSEDFFRRSLIMVPTPEFIVLYNGQDNYPERCVLKLSDAFKVPEKEPALELAVKVYNINKGYNTEIVQKCKSLNDYISLTGRIRENINKGMTHADAINESVKYCLASGMLQDYLEIYGGEVVSILYTEFNIDTALKVTRKETAELEAKKWQTVIADKDFVIAEKDNVIADKDNMIADKDAIIARLQAMVEKSNN
jgi:hypothetical protein